MKGYLSRRPTRFEHVVEISQAYGYRDFADAENELEHWLDDRVWTTGEGPRALFEGAVRWLRERRVLLPGVTRLTPGSWPGFERRPCSGCGTPWRR